MGIPFIIALALSIAANWLVRSIARKRGWVCKPRSGRHIHLSAVPRLGGVGVFASFLIVSWGTTVFHSGLLSISELLKLALPATAMFCMGLWDDLRPLPARTKLLFQIACGCALFLWMVGTPIGLSILELRWGTLILLLGTVGWVVVVSNSMNLIDGVDGLAGGTAVLSLAAIAVIASCTAETQIAYLATVLIACTLGFLGFNFHPATMFLGDCGSLLLGFMIGALGISWSNSRPLPSTMAVAIAIVALPLAETTISVCRRFLSGSPLFNADREHIHHKLLERGLSQRRVVYVLYGVAAIASVAAVGMALGGPRMFLAGAAAVVIVVIAGVGTLRYAEFLEIARMLRRAAEQRRVIANDVLLRKISERITATSCLGILGTELEAAFRSMQFDGFELSLAPWLLKTIPCDARSAVSRWGTNVKTRSFDGPCWTMGMDLLSDRHGNLGWIGLARAVNKGPLLFDANVFVSTLQPAIISALERCLSAQCRMPRQQSTRQPPVTWIVEPVPLPPRNLPVGANSHSTMR